MRAEPHTHTLIHMHTRERVLAHAQLHVHVNDGANTHARTPANKDARTRASKQGSKYSSKHTRMYVHMRTILCMYRCTHVRTTYCLYREQAHVRMHASRRDRTDGRTWRTCTRNRTPLRTDARAIACTHMNTCNQAFAEARTQANIDACAHAHIHIQTRRPTCVGLKLHTKVCFYVGFMRTFRPHV